jgi:hypothetical protein
MPDAAAVTTTFDSGNPRIYRSKRFGRFEVDVNGAPDLK